MGYRADTGLGGRGFQTMRLKDGYYEAILRGRDHRVWDVFDVHHGVPDGESYLGTYLAKTKTGVEVSSTLSPGLWDELCAEIDRNEASTHPIQEEEIPEITPPMPEYTDSVETLESCIDASEYVLAIERGDIEVMLARILKNQITIMTHL